MDVVFGPEDVPMSHAQINKVVCVILKGSTMHYRNGREAKNGDRIIQIGSYGDSAQITAIGVLHSAVAGNDYCNGKIAPIQNADTGACMCDCLHVDDVAALLKEKGLDKRPAGK